MLRLAIFFYVLAFGFLFASTLGLGELSPDITVWSVRCCLILAIVLFGWSLFGKPISFSFKYESKRRDEK
jgi:hypothetical protein